MRPAAARYHARRSRRPAPKTAAHGCKRASALPRSRRWRNGRVLLSTVRRPDAPRPFHFRRSPAVRSQGLLYSALLRRLDKTMPLVKEFEYALPAFQVGRVGSELEPLARTRQRNLEHLADPRA